MMNGVVNHYPQQVETIGVATVARFSIDEEHAKMANLGALFNREPWFMRVNKGEYVKLIVDGQLMMSDTDMEKRTNTEFVKNAKGRVMIAGLGIGLILENLRDKCEKGIVTSIVVYEKYQDVIDLVGDRYKDLPLEIRCEDILEYKPKKGEMYDTIYFDIWPTISTDNLVDMAKLHQRWKCRKPKDGWMNSWMRDHLRAVRERERRNSYFW